MAGVYSVAQVNSYIKNMFAQDFLIRRLSVKGEVSNCKYHSSGHIYFTLTTRPTLLGGNAVIGLYADAASDEALWSWHIWITDADNAALTALAETYVLSADYEADYGSGSVQMMDRNLGAVYKEDGPYARSFRAPLYQWGRKDPFARNLTATRPGGKPYESTPSDLVKTEDATEATGTIAYATRNPQTRLLAAKEWYTGTGGNDLLWGGTAEGSVKTVYDPCP